jgi:hypothetical protein
MSIVLVEDGEAMLSVAGVEAGLSRATSEQAPAIVKAATSVSGHVEFMR